MLGKHRRDIMKATIMGDLLIFIGGVFIILIIVASVFGAGIAFSILGFAAEAEPSYLQDELRSFLSAASYAPGDYEVGIKVIAAHDVHVWEENGIGYVQVEPPETGTGSIFSAVKKVAFLYKNCDIVENRVTMNPLKDQKLFIKKTGDPCNIEIEIRGQE